MAANGAHWSPETERAFKEVLYRFMGEVHATKAALYLTTPERSWRLAVQYGFGRRDRLEREHPDDHTIVRMVRAFENDPRYYNNPDEMPEVDDYLAAAGTTRFMLVPVSGPDGLAGFVDVRDKGAKRPFGADDLEVSRAIASALSRLIGSVADATEDGADEEADGPTAPVEVRETSTAELGEPPALLDDRGFGEINQAAMEALSDPRVVAMAVTVASRRSGATLIHQTAGTSAVELEALIRHQTDTMQAAALPVPPRAAWKTEASRISGPSVIARHPLIASGVVLEGKGSGLVGSVVADAPPTDARRILDRLAARAGAAGDRFNLRSVRRGLARRLLQPGDRRYPELVAHSLGVSRLCWSMARVLGFEEAMMEKAALAGLLHDVGMRELDYDRLYMHPTPGPEDRRTYRMHVEVGERIVRVEGFEEIADAVRHHHERWDGNGYPDRLAGDDIPMLSRIVHVAEVFDLFTAANSYRPAVSRERALAILERAAGHQFDPAIVEAMSRVVA